jgi:hypothetical protein
MPPPRLVTFPSPDRGSSPTVALTPERRHHESICWSSRAESSPSCCSTLQLAHAFLLNKIHASDLSLSLPQHQMELCQHSTLLSSSSHAGSKHASSRAVLSRKSADWKPAKHMISSSFVRALTGTPHFRAESPLQGSFLPEAVDVPQLQSTT